MTKRTEIEFLSTLEVLRGCVSGLTFDEAPELFKDIESEKVRLNVLRDPDYYKKVQADSSAKRMRHIRRSGGA